MSTGQWAKVLDASMFQISDIWKPMLFVVRGCLPVMIILRSPLLMLRGRGGRERCLIWLVTVKNFCQVPIIHLTCLKGCKHLTYETISANRRVFLYSDFVSDLWRVVLGYQYQSFEMNSETCLKHTRQKHCMNYFVCHCDRTPDRNNVGKERLIPVHGSGDTVHHGQEIHSHG